ncbi:MAG: hypothetical protein HY752_02495 [Nitrospirae bacterium]|nr:hypothetical protein [Nitrospirota bacterium]
MPQAQKDLDGFSGKLLSRFEEIILGLYDKPRPHNSKKLSGVGSRKRKTPFLLRQKEKR